MAYAYLPLSVIDQHVPRMRQLGVSTVARAPGGFLPAYRRAGGDPNKLSAEWDRKREAFIKRHYAQVKRRGEPLWKDGAPTRRHLALIAWAYSPDAARRNTAEIQDMRENPPWADKALRQEWDRIAEVGLPMPLRGARGKFEELGCGHYGCVMPTNDDRVVFKLTSDPTEAEFIKLAQPLGWPDGIVRYYGVQEIDFQYRRRQVFAVWREAAHNVGKLQLWGGWKDDYDKRSQLEFASNLARFQELAARVRNALLKAKDASVLWDKAKDLEDWAWRSVSSDDAMGTMTAGRRFVFHGLGRYKGAHNVAASWRACAIIAELMENTYLSDSVGGAFTFYMEHKMLLADVHAGNVGQVEREDYGDPIWVITDPGHVIVLS